MSERYLKLYSLPENLYAEGSPVIIVAGALHKDTQTGEIFAQLKFKSIHSKVIKAISVSFMTFDSFGNQLDTPQEFQYLDLDIKRNDVFGSQIPVYFTNANVRSYSVRIKEVAFADGSFSEPTGTVYETLPKQKLLRDVLESYELVKQYTLDVGNNQSKYEPLVHKDLWLCACGEYNRIGEACHNCSAVYDNLAGFDLKKLEENMSERLEEEARLAEISRKNAMLADGMQQFNRGNFEQAIETFKQIPGWADADEMIVKCQNTITEREEKAKADAIARKIREKRKHRIKVALSIVAAILVMAAIAAYIIFGYMPKLNTYNQAVSLMENRSYEEAIEVFKQVIEFKDSEAQIENCNTAIKQRTYDTAVSLMEDEAYQEAIALFEQIPDYLDSKTQIENCTKASQYNSALALMTRELYQSAINIFEELGDYNDSKEKIGECQSAMYNKALNFLSTKRYNSAISLFEDLGNYKDSKTRIKECNYRQAVDYMDAGNYASAVSAFKQLGSYSDSKTKIKECQYAYVKKYYNSTNQTTYDYLKELKSSKYLDSAKLYEELYSWKATIVANSTAYDYDTNKSSIKRGKPFYFNVKLSGGTPRATTKLSYIITYPNGTKSSRQYWDNSWSSGSSGYVSLTNGFTYSGTLKITVYDGSNNIIGTHSVKITN